MDIPISILFVCMGNICRSPALAAIMEDLLRKQQLSEKILVDSCGLTSYYVGQEADPRMKQEALKWGITISHRAKLFEICFFEEFTYIFGVDKEICMLLQEYARTNEAKKKIYLISDFSEKFQGKEMLDPFYGGERGFFSTMEMAENCCLGILKHILTLKRRLELRSYKIKKSLKF